MKSVEDRLRAAIRAKASQIPAGVPPLHLPARRRRSDFLAYGGGEKDGTPARRRWLAPAASAVVVVAIAIVGLADAGSRVAPASTVRRPAAHAILPIRRVTYLGVYAAGSPPGYGPVADFAQAAGRRPDLVGYFSSWGEPFKTAFATTLRDHGAAALVQIDPADASVAAIAAGDYDSYLRSYADSVRDFGFPVVIGFGHEMNADRYSWGYRHARPAAFIAAWRHIVTLFRGQGADNVTWLWTVEAGGRSASPAASWWPGAQYVSWVGIDGFYYRPSDTFPTMFGLTIAQVRALTNKPVLLAQTAVGPAAGQSAKIQDLFHGMTTYGMLGLVWFDIAQHGGTDQQDWRIQDNPAAERSFRREASSLTAAPARRG